MGLTLETAEPAFILRDASGKEFDGYLATQVRIICKINFTHSTFAEQRTDLISTKTCTSGNGQRAGLLERLASDGILTPVVTAWLSV
jgi:hypothetical protein